MTSTMCLDVLVPKYALLGIDFDVAHPRARCVLGAHVALVAAAVSSATFVQFDIAF